MKTYMLRCSGKWPSINKHIWVQKINGYVDERNYNSINPPMKCPVCGAYVYALTECDPNISYKITEMIVSTFGQVPRYRIGSVFNIPKDSIRLELENRGFTGVEDIERQYYIMTSPDGSKAIFQIVSGNKTQKLILATHELDNLSTVIKQLNILDKRLRKVNSPPKPKPPEFITDAIGNKVIINDWVAFSSGTSSDIRIGQVKKINNKSVSLKERNRKKLVIGKQSSQIVKLPDDQMMIYLLS